MKNSSHGYYGATAAASSLDDDRLGFGFGPGGGVGGSLHTLSRGAQLEAAVEKLPGWYFEDTDARDSGGRARRSQLYLDDSVELLGSVSEANDNDTDDAENQPQTGNTRSRSIRSSYLLDSPIQATVATAGRRHDQKPDTSVLSNSTVDASPPSQKEPRSSSRQQRLSSRRSTISSSCTCTDLVVTRYTTGGRDKKVLYHIDVVNHESQLQTYTIRRSYTDFKVLHSDLSAMLDARKEYVASKSLLHEPPASSSVTKERRSLNTTTTTTTTTSMSIPNLGWTTTAARLRSQQSSSPEDAFEAAVLAFSLPPLPHAGLMSFWRRHDHAHLKHRCAVFQELLRAILKLPFLRESFAMQTFLSTAPCAIRERGSSYVSLCEYSVPHIDLDEEHRERRRRAQEHRRNSSATSTSQSVYEY